MSARHVSQWCAPWVPEHAYVDNDAAGADLDGTWAAMWSTPDGMWELHYAPHRLEITGQRLEVALEYPDRERVEAMLGFLLGDRERAAEPEVVEHEEVGGYSGPGRQRGIQCSCGTWYEGDADEIREAFARHIERVPPQRLRDRDGDIWVVVTPGKLRSERTGTSWTASEVERALGPLTDPDRPAADQERAS